MDVADLDQMMEEFSNQQPKRYLNDDDSSILTQPLDVNSLETHLRHSIEEIEADRLIQELENDEKENESNLMEDENNSELLSDNDFVDAIDFPVNPQEAIHEQLDELVDVNDIFGDSQSSRPSTSLGDIQ